MVPKNPLTDAAETDREDQELVARSQQGSREALEQLIARHQPWIYNITLRMLFQRQDREQRLIYVLGDIFGVTDAVGGELLEISRDNFRQKLARSRRDLHSFMQNQCGLVNTANPCRCAKKTMGFAKAGYLDPQKLVFAREHVTRVRDVAEKRYEQLEALDAAYAAIHREHPFLDPPDFVSALRSFIGSRSVRSTLELE